MNEKPKCEDGEHFIKVWFCEEKPINKSYYLGVCMLCGLTMTLPVDKIEEVFQHV